MKKFSKIIPLFFIYAIILYSQAFASSVLTWNSEEGLQRLQRSTFKNDFYQLVNYYQPQSNPLYCGMASGVVVLNALHDKIPSQKGGQWKAASGRVIAFHSYSQASFLNDKTDQVKTRQVIEMKAKDEDGKYDAGVSLDDFAKILSDAYGLDVTVKHADDQHTVTHFRQDLKHYLADKTHFIVANFKGKLIGNKTGGHISPVVAFDQASDSVLVLDVALHKNPWFWVDVEDFYQAMHSLDGDVYRGYVVVAR